MAQNHNIGEHMRKHTLIIMMIALCAAVVCAKSKDILYLKTGEEQTGELRKIDDSKVLIKTTDGDKTFAKDSVRSIDIGTWRAGDDWKTRADIDDSLLLAAIKRAGDGMSLGMEFPTAGQITIYESATLTFEKDGSATVVERYIQFVAAERGKDVANFRRAYCTDFQDITIDFARAVSMKGEITTLADNALENGYRYSYLPEYQRVRNTKFALKGSEVGSIIDYQFTVRSKNIDAFKPVSASWNFYSTEPILESHFAVKYHKDAPVKLHSVAINGTETKKGDYITVDFVKTNIEPYVEEALLPDLDIFMPNVKVTYAQPAEKLATAFYARISAALDAETELKSRLTKAFGAQKPSIEQVYNYVSENYTTNGVWLNGDYQYPKPLSKLLTFSSVASHEYVFLLYAFLRAAGFAPELVLLGPSINTDVPSELFDITYCDNFSVKIDDAGTVRYLLPSEYSRYDNCYLDAQWILPIAQSGAKWEQIPRKPGNFAYAVPIYECTLDTNGTLSFVYTEKYYGTTGGDGWRYHKNDKPRSLDNFFQSLAKNIDELAELRDYKIKGYKSLNEKVFVTYSVDIPGYATTTGDVIAFRLPSVNFGASSVGASSRKLPFAREGNVYSEKRITISLPKGYDVEYLPSSLKSGVGYRNVDATITVDGSKLIYIEKLDGTHAPLLEPEKYADYKSYIEQLSRFGESWILLRKHR